MRGNVVDLAVAVVIGAAFGAVITAFVKDIITPIIGIAGGLPDFSAWVVTIGASKFFIGDFINAVLSFVVIAAVIYFLVIAPVNKLMERMRPETPPSAARYARVSRVPEQDPGQGPPLCLLHRRGHHGDACDYETALVPARAR